MLLPEFIQSLAGENQGGTETNALVADYLSGQVQSTVFRGLERELERKLGLENLTLQYDLGKNFRQALGASDQQNSNSTTPAWQVGFTKGFFDRIYLNMNYSQFSQTSNQQQIPSQQIFNYQLTYKLTPIWSIIYYREPTSFTELTSGYQKGTLSAGFSF